MMIILTGTYIFIADEGLSSGSSFHMECVMLGRLLSCNFTSMIRDRASCARGIRVCTAGLERAWRRCSDKGRLQLAVSL